MIRIKIQKFLIGIFTIARVKEN